MSWPLSAEWTALFGALIVVGGSLIAAIGVWRGATEQSALTKKLADQSKEIGERSEALVRKSEEIARLTREAIGAVTGREGFVYLEPLRKGGLLRYFIRHQGDQPAYDVSVRIEKVVPTEDGVKKVRHLIFRPVDVARTLLRGSGFDWTYPDLDASRRPREWPLSFPEPPPRGSIAYEFRVELAARSGIFVQRLRVSPSAERWETVSNWFKGPRNELRLPDFRETQNQEANPSVVYDDGQ